MEKRQFHANWLALCNFRLAFYRSKKRMDFNDDHAANQLVI